MHVDSLSVAVTSLKALCVARHRFLAEHFVRFFADPGIECVAAVGISGALRAARSVRPDVVLCDYDLLTTLPLDRWERDEVLQRTPVVAVSLTRRPDEVNPLDANAIAGFLYLPILERADALRLLHAAAARPRYTPGETTTATGVLPAEAR